MLRLTSTCLLELLSAEHLRETNISIFVSHSLMVTCSLDVFEEERNENEKGKSRGVTRNYVH